MTSFKLILILIVTTLGSLSVLALDCYVCEYTNGKDDPVNCKDNPDKKVLVEIEDELMVPITSSATSENSVNDPIKILKNSITPLGTAMQSDGDESPPSLREDDWPNKYCIRVSEDMESGTEKILRTAVGAKSEDTFKNGCESGNRINATGFGFTNNTRICYCDWDGCNKSNNETDYNGASTNKVFSFVSLIVLHSLVPIYLLKSAFNY